MGLVGIVTAVVALIVLVVLEFVLRLVVAAVGGGVVTLAP